MARSAIKRCLKTEGSEGAEGAEGAIAAAPEEADHDEEDELRGLAQFLGQSIVKHFVGAGDSPEPLADMMDHWGPYIKVESRLAAEQMCSIPWDIVTDEFPRASISLALGKAREKLSLLLSTVAPEGVWGT